MVGEDVTDAVGAGCGCEGLLEGLHGVGAGRGGGREEAEGLLDERRDGLGRRGNGANGFDAGDFEGSILDPAREPDALDAVKHEVGGAVGLPDAGTNEAGGAPWENVIIRAADAGADAEHAVALEGMMEHGAVALLKDEQREEAAWEEVAVREGHDGQGDRQIDLLLGVEGFHDMGRKN